METLIVFELFESHILLTAHQFSSEVSTHRVAVTVPKLVNFARTPRKWDKAVLKHGCFAIHIQGCTRF